MFKSSSRKNTAFHMIQRKKNDEVLDLGYRKNFRLLTSEYLLQMTVFERMVDYDIIYKDLKKCFSPLRFYLHDWRIIETIRYTRCNKEK